MSVNHEKPEQYTTERGRNNPIGLVLHKKLYAEKEVTGDVTFIIGSERIRAHRCVLAAISEKFKAQFYGPHPDKGDMEIFGSTASAFRKFIQFFYLDTVLLTIDDIQGVLDLANQSLVDGIVTLCVDYLKNFLAKENVFFCLRLASMYDIYELKKLCEWLIKNETAVVFGSEDFMNNCDRDVLLEVLKLDTFNCQETVTFDACLEWAKVACKRRNLNAEKVENLRFELGDAVTQIRFGCMSMEEFDVRQTSYGELLFSQDETNEILNLIQSNDFKPEKFNPTPRQNTEQLLQKKCLECDRRLSYGSVDVLNFTNASMVLAFICSHVIRLEGFTVGTSDCDGFNIDGIIINGKEHPINCLSKLKTEENATTVIFDNPIDVDSRSMLEISFKFKNIRMFTKYELAKRVNPNNVSFTFYNFNDICVTKLLYNLK